MNCALRGVIHRKCHFRDDSRNRLKCLISVVPSLYIDKELANVWVLQ